MSKTCLSSPWLEEGATCVRNLNMMLCLVWKKRGRNEVKKVAKNKQTNKKNLFSEKTC